MGHLMVTTKKLLRHLPEDTKTMLGWQVTELKSEPGTFRIQI